MSDTGHFEADIEGRCGGRLAQLHHRLLTIHPFMDANGRAARSSGQRTVEEGIGREFIEDAQAYATLATADCRLN
jgi:fido (protein-threonine AMPylation protein)